MKTIRDYINLIENAQSQVDEMDRRSFLKGAGAAAVAGTVGAGAYMDRGKGASGNFEGNDGTYIDQILRLRLALSTMYGGKTEQDLARVNGLIKKYLQANPKMKPVLESEWKLINNNIAELQAKDGSGYDDLYKILPNKESVLANFEKFLQGEDPIFHPKVKGEFDDLSETSDSAVVKVEQLFRHK